MCTSFLQFRGRFFPRLYNARIHPAMQDDFVDFLPVAPSAGASAASGATADDELPCVIEANWRRMPPWPMRTAGFVILGRTVLRVANCFRTPPQAKHFLNHAVTSPSKPPSPSKLLKRSNKFTRHPSYALKPPTPYNPPKTLQSQLSPPSLCS